MEFNLKTLRPTYHLTLGIPGRSNALLIAKRLNVPDEILENAREMVNPAELKSDELLNEIHHQREVALKARSAADRDRSLATNLRTELSQRLDNIEQERQAVMDRAREEVEAELKEVREELHRIRKTLSKTSPAVEEMDTLQPVIEQVETKLNRKPARRKSAPVLEPPTLEIGRRVTVRTLKMEGVLTAVNGEDAEVQVGSLRVRAKVSDLTAPLAQLASPTPTSAEPKTTKSAGNVFHPSPGMELDLRGMRAEDALERLDKYLDDAELSGMPFVRIIHGKGTGRLRQVIREALRDSSQVSSYEEGGEKEGGEGVTIAHLGSE
jgi:DNA mismatch repair protein MutS2